MNSNLQSLALDKRDAMLTSSIASQNELLGELLEIPETITISSAGIENRVISPSIRFFMNRETRSTTFIFHLTQ